MPNIKWKNSKVKRVHTTEEAKKLMSQEGPLMLVIYADWCGHCQTAEPEWTKLADSVDGKATVYAIESDDYKDDDVSGYPTIKIIKGGKTSLYEGDRSAESMKDALLKGNGLLGGKRSRRRGTRRLRNRARKTHRTLS
jgi:thiol-disulfide isomerase/thioredoxin